MRDLSVIVPSGGECVSRAWLPRRAGVYVIERSDLNHVYIGSAVNIARRHGEHQRMLRRGAHENVRLQRAWNKYGPDNFAFMVVLFCEPDDAVRYEQVLIESAILKSGWRSLFNSAPNAGSCLGFRHSEATRARMSARTPTFLGCKHSPESLALMSERQKQNRKNPDIRAKYCRPCHEETKRKIGLANTGRVLSDEHKQKLSAAFKGRPFPASTKQPSRFAGRHHTAEAKARMSAKLKNRQFSDDTRRKISEGVLAAKARNAAMR